MGVGEKEGGRGWVLGRLWALSGALRGEASAGWALAWTVLADRVSCLIQQSSLRRT